MYNQELIDRINAVVPIEAVAESIIQLKKSGQNFIGDCPKCGGKKKLSISPKVKKFNCFSCDVGGHNVVDLLRQLDDLSAKEAIEKLILVYNIDTDISKPTTRKDIQPFRDIQLGLSGITRSAQKYHLIDKDGTRMEYDRYEAATLDTAYWTKKSGDDMILNYLGLDGQPILYGEGTRQKPLVRVRWANPALHVDKNGNPMKYQSPPKSGSHLWLPQPIIAKFQQKIAYDTLYITEGEKKADKMTQHGMDTVALMGIHNLTNQAMPAQFEEIIKCASVKTVVFVMDSDLFDISTKGTKAVDMRPKTFFSAVKKFREYFQAYAENELYLQIFLAYGIDANYKGIDDLLVRELQGAEDTLVEDFGRAMISREHKGKYIQAINLRLTNDHQLEPMWGLDTPVNFLEKHKEQLSKCKEFKLRNIEYVVGEDGIPSVKQDIQEEELFWDAQEVLDRATGRQKLLYSFNYVNSLIFLKNRGFGLYKVPQSEFDFLFIRIENSIVSEVREQQIQRFVHETLRAKNETLVLNMLLKGGAQYLGKEKLSALDDMPTKFVEPEKQKQLMYFENTFWEITEDKITVKQYNELPGHIWKDKKKAFEPKLIGDTVKIIRKGEEWQLAEMPKAKESDIYKFFAATSNFSWEKQFELEKQENGLMQLTARTNKETLTDKEVQAYNSHFICKMIATGYLLHEFHDKANMKAIIAMDGKESEVGKSNGGTGKSIWSTMFKHVVPTFVIDGKEEVEKDKFLFEGVDNRTRAIVFDDCNRSLPFEHFFSKITNELAVNGKFKQKVILNPPPKMVFSTNHAISGDSPSFRRRQYLISFSDFFNEYNTPKDYLGRLMFDDWDEEQWNCFYNFMAQCIQTYLRYGLKFTIPQEDLERRKLRQDIGENFLEWANNVFSQQENDYGYITSEYLNKYVEKGLAYQSFIEEFPNDRKYINTRTFKEKLQKYCQYAKLDFNPGANAEKRLKSGSTEFICCANNKFDIARVQKLYLTKMTPTQPSEHQAAQPSPVEQQPQAAASEQKAPPF